METRTQTGKWVGIILSFLVILWFSTKSEATDVVLEGGLSYWAPYPDGVWVQRDYEHTEKWRSIYYRASIVQKLSTHFSASVGLFHLGRYSVESDATSDDCYQNGNHATCPMYGKFLTSGSARGGMITGIFHTQNEMFTLFSVPIGQPFLEAGFTQYRQTFRLRQTNYEGFDYRGNTMNTGTIVGFGTKYKKWKAEIALYGIGATYHIDGANEFFPATTDSVWTFSIGRIF